MLEERTFRDRAQRSATAWRAAALSVLLAGCTDFVFSEAPAGCGFPAGTELAVGGTASPTDLGIQTTPVDPLWEVGAYVTEEHVQLPDGSMSRAVCLEWSEDREVRYWVDAVGDDWEFPEPRGP